MEVDLFSLDSYRNGAPHQLLRDLRKRGSVHWQPCSLQPRGGYWAVLSHQDIVAVSKDAKRFSSARFATQIENPPEEELAARRMMLLNMDPPEHATFRQPIVHEFTDRALNKLSPRIRELARASILRGLSLQQCDFVHDVAGLLPTQVLCEMLGIPEQHWQMLVTASDTLVGYQDPELAITAESTQNASMDMAMCAMAIASERRQCPMDDMISKIVKAPVNGCPMDDMQFISFFIQVFVAGNETTRSLIALGTQLLIQRPDLWQALEQNPALIPGAIEEMLRMESPMHYFRRTAMTDCSIGGQAIRQDDAVVLMYPSGNFDETVFQAPETFDLHRTPNPHLSFGIGEHFCIGAGLARLEARIFFEELFSLCRGVENTGPLVRLQSNLVNAAKSMPVRMAAR